MKKVIAFGLVAASLASCGAPASPQRKAGLWEQAIQSDQSPTPMVSQACYDAASDRRMPVLPKKPQPGGRRQCDTFNVSKNGADYVIDSVCGFTAAPSLKITLHAVISGDFSSKYTVTNNITVAGSPDAERNGTHKAVITATYKGDCPADIGPGQVKLPSGEVVDMAALRNRFGGGGGGRGGGGENSGPGGGNAASNSASGNSTAGGGQ